MGVVEGCVLRDLLAYRNTTGNNLHRECKKENLHQNYILTIVSCIEELLAFTAVAFKINVLHMKVSTCMYMYTYVGLVFHAHV